MDVILIGTSFNEEIHGTSNGKKTGCGVNLLKAGNDTKYRQIGKMNDLKEITCEKCKEKIAKEMIKSDKKEMSRLLKEEKARMKAGIEDEGIVPLGNTTARITSPQTSAPAPEPVSEPEPVHEQAPVKTIPGTGVPMDSDLAKFAINAPVPEEPAPAPQSDEDFLAQFAVNKPEPEEEKPQDNNIQDDFLAQFAIDPNAQNEPKSSENDDIMSMFAIGNQPTETVEQLPQDEPSPVQGMYDNDSNVVDVEEESLTAVNEPNQPQSNNAWDVFANQFFGMSDGNSQQESEPEEEAPLEMDDMPAVDGMAAPPPVPAPSAPVLDDITPEELSPVLDEVIPPAREEYEPDLEDIAVPSFDEVIPFANEDIAPPELDEIEVPQLNGIQMPAEPDYQTEYTPELDDISTPDIDDISTPDIDDIAPEPIQPEPVKPEPAPVYQQPVQPEPAPVYQQPVQPAPAPVYQQPVQPAPAPVYQQPVQPAPAPVYQQPVQPAPAPVYQQPVQPAPAPVYQQPAVGQFVTVPTGYDPNGQPIYAYMQITGYDPNGQPILAPAAGMSMPSMQTPYAAPMQNTAPKFGSSPNAPSKYGKAGLTPGQKIAAEAAARGDMMDANISKIATNPHSKSTSDAFIHAISGAKDKANQSLTDTQGLKPSAPVITSIEDMLSQLGDNSEKEKQMKKAAAAKNVPQYEEFTSTSSFSSRTSRSSAPKTKAPAQPDRPLTKKELKELEKQRKIDEKFRKEMEKRKG